ncbi:PQQ-binding-like beta-propeller repeat protein [Acetivibrio clariflavus]|uniref:Pyrrolo-quinoline quinone repeat domain-containing protein n=1 Tax=Acetivibrio clariflavus (strain DSM 19732 / NBRC 101661 / EBR45) TaxID=720554 RepID=G8LTY0_ACECE|nr:PQQ-binding-like beta-propeller repeat protein [Acetivibrio clariflavus]AEV67326.1 hypothetical protein Clocl_0617 [Acetivibrio clariflavus DSM 19732]
MKNENSKIEIIARKCYNNIWFCVIFPINQILSMKKLRGVIKILKNSCLIKLLLALVLILNITACNNGKDSDSSSIKPSPSSVKFCDQAEDFLICLSIYGDLQCFDINNQKILWNQKYSIYSKNIRRLIFDDKLILAIGNELIHIDLKSGKTLSEKSLKGGIAWIIKDDNKRFIVVGTEEDLIYCFDGENNRKLWSKKIDNGAFISPVILGNSLVFQWHFNGPHYVQGAIEHKIYSLDINNGKKNWEYESKARLLPGIFTSQKGIIFSDVEGTITYMKAEDGNILWKCDTNENQRDIYFDMAVYGNTLAFFHTEGKVYFLDEDTGNIVYKDTIGKTFSNVKIYDENSIYVCEYKVISSYSLKEKRTLNSLDLTPYVHYVELSDNSIYVKEQDRKIHALEMENFKEQWIYEGRLIESELFISGNYLIFVSSKEDNTNEFVMLDRATGKEVKVIS